MKNITIKDIADICNVSRGTVDRVIHNRGNVSRDTELKIREAIEKFNYNSDTAGRMLAYKKKGFNIGVILVSKHNPFFDRVKEGINDAKKEYLKYGVNVDIEELDNYDVTKQLAVIEEMEETSDCIVLNPIDDILIKRKIDELVDLGKIIISLNTDIDGSKRMCYIGSDYIKGGEIACGIIALLKNCSSNLAMITGSKKILGHNQRIEGFKNTAKARYPNINVECIVETQDDDRISYKKTKEVLCKHRIDSILIIAGGVEGVCRAVEESKLRDQITIVSFDEIPITREMIRKGVIKATICQQPYVQGYKAIEIAYDYFISGNKLEKDKFIVKHEIKILENI